MKSEHELVEELIDIAVAGVAEPDNYEKLQFCIGKLIIAHAAEKTARKAAEPRDGMEALIGPPGQMQTIEDALVELRAAAQAT